MFIFNFSAFLKLHFPCIMQFLAKCRSAVVLLVLVIANSSKLSESSSSLQRIYPSSCRNIRHPMFSDELTINFC